MNKVMRLLLPRTKAITLAPFGIYLRDESLTGEDLNHEMIHLYQQLEMLIIPFYIWYGLEWLIKLIRWGNLAYYKLSFEREAYDNEDNGEYLCTRKTFAWTKYL